MTCWVIDLDKSPFELVSECEAVAQTSETTTVYKMVTWANDGGLFAFASLSLAMFSVALVVVTILGFWYYRGIVDKRAELEVRERLPDILEEFCKRNPSVFVDAVRSNADLLRGVFTDDNGGRDYSEEIASAIDRFEDDENGDGPGNH